MIFRFLILLLFVFPLKSDERISLKQICEGESCRPRVWEIREGFDPASAFSVFSDSSWRRVDSFPIWADKFFPPKNDYAVYTYRTVFDAPNEFLTGDRQPGIKLGEAGEVFSIYINGNLIASEGKSENGKIVHHRTVRNKVWQINPKHLRLKNNVLTLKIEGDPRYDHTGLYFTQGYEIDFLDELEYEKRDILGISFMGIYFVVGLYHLLLFSKRRNELYNLYFGVFSLFLPVYIFTRSNIVFEFPADSILIQRIELIVLYPLPMLITVFAEQLFFGKVSKFSWKILYIAGALALPNLFVPGFIMEHILRVWQVMTLFTITYSFTVIVKAVRMRLPNSRRLFWGMTALILTAAFDIVDSLVLNTGLAFTKFAFLIFVIGVAGMLSNRFLELYEEVEDHRNNLEKKVTERTKELQSTLQQVQILKEQQDGDYFLTTLIVNPLIAKKSSSESVKIDFLISQKKKFDFKKRIHEIGGDICISESIVLRGKKYSVFVNGDAMGKSIQGAGGALVLGVVFHSLVSRTRYFRTNKDIFPERWLKMAFQELQSVFESFDGSMLISVVMGLIDDENGAMYYMNAEHPWTVLYRDGKASFIEDELTVHKLGMTIMESRFTVKTFQLLDNDVIIIGSDGRDDLKLYSGDGNAINEDGDLFLKTVEETGAVLREIYEKTKEIGEITDDFSLLRIHYNEIKWEYDAKQFDLHMKKAQLLYRKARRREAIDEFEKAYSNKRSEKNLLRIIARIFMKMKEYERAGNYFAKYAEASPLDEKYIYMTAEAYRESGRTEDAIDFSERLRIRNPFDIRNLKLLIALYENTGNTEKAEGLREDLELVLNQNVMI